MSVNQAEAEIRLRMSSDAEFCRRRLYAQMCLIRQFEERILALFEQNELGGTTHCSIGQEADAVGVLNHLQANDVVWSTHRCHGHYLARGGRPESLMAELMGRAGGVCGGRGGSQHLAGDNFFSNGVQGGIVPTAVGMALAEKIKRSGAISVCFLGDGTLGEGVVYEALNLASLWSAPVLLVLENNRWAQSTPVERQLAGSMIARPRAFGIAAGEIDSTDAEALFAHFAPLVEWVRREQKPRFEIIHTYRLCHHSKSDDMRPAEEVELRKRDDPLPRLRARLPQAVAQEIEREAAERVDAAVEWARLQPFPQLGARAASAGAAL